MELKVFVLTSKYLQPAEEVAKFSSQHQAWLNPFFPSGRILVAGKLNPPTGGFIVARAESLEEIQTWINHDPYAVNKVAHYDVVELSPSVEPRRSPEFNAFLARPLDKSKER